MMRARFRALCLSFLLPLVASAQERIVSFDSEIEIAVDSSMIVTETIVVRAEGNRIRRGILRDFPTDYEDDFGNRIRIGFDVLSVRRDGMPEPFRRERIGNGVRLRIGSANVFLDTGEHEYEISYRTTWQLGFFDNHDELWWNVTGNGWDFPIGEASARVILPASPPSGALGIEGFVGAYGSREQFVETSVESPNVAFVGTTRPLRAAEGLTLVATWPKGIVREPTAVERAARTLNDNRGLLAAIAGFVLAFAWLLVAWFRVGKDPAPGVIYPQYEPPERFSPASVRYVSRMGYDTKAFTAAVINLAVKGYVDITENDDEYTLTRKPAGTIPLAPGESALLEALFREGSSIELKNENHAIVSAAQSAHRSSLKRDYFKTHFVTNTLVVLPAVLALGLAFLAGVLMIAVTPAAVVVLGLGIVAVVVFAFLMRAPTDLGRRMLDRIEGFKLYLEVAEKDELQLRNPPDKTPELFERFLPYALALGVEHLWADKFAAVFDSLAAEKGQAYSPVWYHGQWNSHSFGSNIGQLTAMTGSLGTAIASSSVAPGSSSGSGGGGFSGGGVGGGGGGGW